MRCPEVHNMVPDLLAGESGPLGEKIKQHVDTCDACKTAFGPLLDLEFLTRQMPLRHLPPGFDQRFRRRLAGRRVTAGADVAPPGPLRLLAYLGSLDCSWLLWLALSAGLIHTLEQRLPSAAGQPFELTITQLTGLLAVMALALPFAATVAFLNGLLTTSWSEEHES